MNKRTFLSLIVFIFLVYQNCAPLEGTGSATNFSLGGTASFSQVKAILDSKCVTCHSTPTAQNRNVGLSTYQAIIDSDIVLGGNAQNSLLYISVDNGSMPQGLPPLSLEETEAIRTWIESGAPDEDGIVANQIPIITMPANRTVQLPANNIEFLAQVRDLDGQILRTVWSQVSGPNTARFSGDRTSTLIVNNVVVGDYVFELLVEDDFGAQATAQVALRVNPAPAGDQPAANPTVSFAMDVAPILTNRCSNCHSGATPSGNFSMDSYQQVVSRVNFQTFTNSTLYIRVNGDTMPPAGQTPLGAMEKATLLTWIQEGAQNN